MNDNFGLAIGFVFKWEGGYCNHPSDPGGETNYGISKRSYPELDIKNMTKAQAREIYKRDYWDKCECDLLVYPLDICVFNCAVNCGRGRAILFQNGAYNWQDYLMRQIAYYASLATAKTFLRGWVNRTLDLWKMIKEQPCKP